MYIILKQFNHFHYSLLIIYIDLIILIMIYIVLIN